ncbi:MAG: hypothetical protein KC503_03140 [Myxococcales bacterium]|nr:hypothetical protein [Myxococcales bacterium]
MRACFAAALAALSLVASAGLARAKPMRTVLHVETRKRSLPQTNIELDPKGGGWSVSRFVGKAVYLTLSGPPGGPLGLEIRAHSAKGADRAVLAQLARRHDKGAVLGKLVRVTFAGKKRAALPYVKGSQAAHSSGCVVLIRRAGRGRGIYADAYVSAGARTRPSCKAVLGNKRLAPTLATLKIGYAHIRADLALFCKTAKRLARMKHSGKRRTMFARTVMAKMKSIPLRTAFDAIAAVADKHKYKLMLQAAKELGVAWTCPAYKRIVR